MAPFDWSLDPAPELLDLPEITPPTSRRELRERGAAEAQALAPHELVLPPAATHTPALHPLPIIEQAPWPVREPLVQAMAEAPVEAPSETPVDSFTHFEAFSNLEPVEPPLEYTRAPVRPRDRASRRASRALAQVKALRSRPSITVRSQAGPPASKPGKPRSRRRLLSKFFTFGAMVGVGALIVTTSLPANAFFSPNFLAAASSQQAGVAQHLQVQDTALVATATRDNYTVASLADQLRLRYSSSEFRFTNDPNGTIQWPFAISVPIASGFGDRQVENCSFCSTFHEGVDFTPGAGAPIQSIADGVVSLVDLDPHAGLGNHVVIDHVINGQKIQSVYGHMLTDSVRVVVGQTVKVGDEVGQVGSTGASTGAHLHLEIHVNGTPVDPFAWLKANAN
ncbi:MAG: family peptidase [Microbacteriaceae bacterium]|nr:family peptidase [Microbacteriaceae bacterium]